VTWIVLLEALTNDGAITRNVRARCLEAVEGLEVLIVGVVVVETEILMIGDPVVDAGGERAGWVRRVDPGRGSGMRAHGSLAGGRWCAASPKGMGGSAGLHYQINHAASVGLAYHTPVWFQQFTWNRKDLTGVNHTLNFKMNLPQILSVGVALSPSPKTHIGIDARWFNYSNTSGFAKAGFNSDGSVAGFGWNNIWAFGGGIQRQVGATTKIMAGYNFSQNPIPAKYTFFNTPAPAIVQHHISGGIIETLHSGWELNATYYHAFRNSISGSWYSGQGPVPGTSVTSRMSENSLTLGLAKTF